MNVTGTGCAQCSALYGMAQAQQRFAQAAGAAATDVVGAAVGMAEAKTAFAVSVHVLKASLEAEKSLLDILA